MNGVSQDSDLLRGDADAIRTYADNFKKQYENLFSEMEANLKAEADESVAWWGPQAGLFLENFKAKEEDFINAYNNITNMAQNLEEQADAWDAFEGV
jgi:cytochrome c556